MNEQPFDNQVKFRAFPPMLGRLKDRTRPNQSIGLTARRDLELFYELVDLASRELGYDYLEEARAHGIDLDVLPASVQTVFRIVVLTHRLARYEVELV